MRGAVLNVAVADMVVVVLHGRIGGIESAEILCDRMGGCGGAEIFRGVGCMG
jgi:hypothetical protein